MDIIQEAKRGKLESVKECIREGAIDIQDGNGMTALMHAVDGGNLPLARLLISEKANVNLTDKYGQTAIMIAAGRNQLAIVQALIKAKSDLGIVSKSGLTAYGFAASEGNREAGEMIKKAGGK